MLKVLAVSIALLPSNPMTPRMATAFNQMVTDYAQCSNYWDFSAAYYGITNPGESTVALGGIANAAYEARRLVDLLDLPDDTFEKRRAATRADMIKTLDSYGFSQLYSVFDGFCTTLKDDPGRAFIQRLPKESKPIK
jgi:hypothetical protein